MVCMGNNPQKIQIYGAVLSLYVNRLIKLVNQKGKLKSSLIFDEFHTIYLNNIDTSSQQPEAIKWPPVSASKILVSFVKIMAESRLM
jgi:hypothetical protein